MNDLHDPAIVLPRHHRLLGTPHFRTSLVVEVGSVLLCRHLRLVVAENTRILGLLALAHVCGKSHIDPFSL